MSEKLLNHYGYCILEPGTKIWTVKDEDFILNDFEVFFSLYPYNVNTGFYGSRIFECEIIKQIKCICPLFLNRIGKTFTYFPEIFENEMNISWKYKNNVQMKSSIEDRKVLIKFLHDKNIPGWISPVETSPFDIELLIFNPKTFIKITSEIPKISKKTIKNLPNIKAILGEILKDQESTYKEIITKLKKNTNLLTPFDYLLE